MSPRRDKNTNRRGKAGRFAALAALFLSLALLLTSCGGMLGQLVGPDSPIMPWGRQDTATTTTVAPPKEDMRTVPYAEMKYERPDVDALLGRLEEIAKEVADAKDFDTLMALDNEGGDLTEDFYTQRNLAELRKYQDIYDDYYNEEYRYCDKASVDVGIAGNEVNRAILQGPYADDYREEVGDYVYKSIENGLRLSDKKVEAYQKERSELNADYNDKLAKLTVSYNGKDYTMEEIMALDDWNLTYQLYTAYYAENAPWFADVYNQMIQLDKKTAETLGFDSAADMYYLQFDRDYTPDQALQYCAMAKEWLAPVVPQVMSYYGSSVTLAYDATLSNMPALLSGISPQLAEVFSSMQDYGLCDFAANPKKQSGIGFTTDLYSYDASFCYSYWQNDLRGASTIIHEFGHYYDSWLHMGEDVVQNLDVAEIYSQGLELLALGGYDKLGVSVEEVTLNTLQDFLETLTYQALLEEFQLRAYEMDSVDATSLGRLYASLLVEYGYDAMPDTDGAEHSWFQITHLFDAPFYTISYATSACTALQFYVIGQDKGEAAAVDAYLSLIQSDQNRPFLEMLAGDGLKSPFDESLMEEFAGMYTQVFGVRYSEDAAAPARDDARWLAAA